MKQRVSPPVSTILAGIGTLGLMTVSSAASALPGLPFAISSYFDTARNANQVFYLDGYGGIDVQSYTDGVSGAWSCTRTLPSCTVVYNSSGTATGCTSLNTAEFAPGGNLVATFDGSTGHLYYVGNDAALWEAWGNPPSSANVHSLTAASGASSKPWSEWSTYGSPLLAGNTIPGLNPAATLAAYDVSGADQHIFFRGLDDNLHETYYNGTWHDRLLPATTNMSNALSGADETAYWDGSVGHVFFVDQASTINEFYWYNGNWWGGLSGNASAGFPDFFLAGMESSIGGAHQSVYGSSESGGSIVEANCRSGSCWTESTTVPPGGQVWASPMLTFSSPSQELLFYVGGDNNVYSSQNATAINVSAGAPAVGQSGTPVHQSPLTGYWDPWFGDAFVFYVGQDAHVHQLYATSAAGPWHHTDMTTNAGCYHVGD